MERGKIYRISQLSSQQQRAEDGTIAIFEDLQPQFRQRHLLGENDKMAMMQGFEAGSPRFNFGDEKPTIPLSEFPTETRFIITPVGSILRSRYRAIKVVEDRMFAPVPGWLFLSGVVVLFAFLYYILHRTGEI